MNIQKRFDKEFIAEILVGIFKETTFFSFDEMKNIVSFYDNDLVRKLYDYMHSIECQNQFKLQFDEYENNLLQVIRIKLNGIEDVEKKRQS